MPRRNRYPWSAVPAVSFANAIADAASKTIRGQWPLKARRSGELIVIANERRFRKKWFKRATSSEIALYIGNFSKDPAKHKSTQCRTGDTITESDFSVWAFPKELNVCTQTYSIFYNHPTRIFFPGWTEPPCIFCPESVCAFLNYASNRWESEAVGKHPISAPARPLENIPAYAGGDCFPCGQFQLLERENVDCEPTSQCFQNLVHPCTGNNWVVEACSLSPRILPIGDTVILTSDLCCRWWVKDCCDPFEV